MSLLTVIQEVEGTKILVINYVNTETIKRFHMKSNDETTIHFIDGTFLDVKNHPTELRDAWEKA